jgi:hypothetical protein
MRGAIPQLLQYAFMAWGSFTAQGQLYFLYNQLNDPSFRSMTSVSLKFSVKYFKNKGLVTKKSQPISEMSPALVFMYASHDFRLICLPLLM